LAGEGSLGPYCANRRFASVCVRPFDLSSNAFELDAGKPAGGAFAVMI